MQYSRQAIENVIPQTWIFECKSVQDYKNHFKNSQITMKVDLTTEREIFTEVTIWKGNLFLSIGIYHNHLIPLNKKLENYKRGY